MKGAKIYDMDEEVVDIKRWSELKNVRAYFDFFKKHEKEFLDLFEPPKAAWGIIMNQAYILL